MAQEECKHEFGALGAVSGDWCIHCGTKMQDLCPFSGVNACWDAQDERADPNFTCPLHGQARDTLSRLGADVL